MVSSFGRIKCLNYLHHAGKTGLSFGTLQKSGYLHFTLYNEMGITKQVRVHRLIAQHFIPNPKNKPFINHKNGKRNDNSVLNLEWCTARENTFHAFVSGLIKRKQTAVVGTSIKDGSKVFFNSFSDAAYFVNGCRASISRCVKKQYNRTVAYGYKWESNSSPKSTIKL